jgi:DnaJ-domain-containing protein 1
MWKPTTAPEETHHDAMNTVLAPVRWLKSLAQTAILLAIAVGIGLAYPLIMYVNGEPVTLAAFAIPLLVILALFTLFYAPVYLIFGSIGGTFLFGCMLGFPWFDHATDNISFKWLIFGFLAVGILQRYIRTHLHDNPLPSGGQVGSGTREYDGTRCEECGIDFSEPTEYCGQCVALQTASRSSRNEDIHYEPNEPLGASDKQYEEQARVEEEQDASSAGSPSGRNSGRATCEECVKYFAVVGLPVGTSDSEVRQKRRAWAEVLHPDQLGSKSEMARNAAEEQPKSINEACEHILTCRDRERANGDASQPPPVTIVESIPLRDAVIKAELFISTMSDKMTTLQATMFPGFRTKEEIAAAIQDCLYGYREGISLLTAVIGRIKREAPDASVAGLESALATMVKQQAEIEGYAAHAALRSQSADMMSR